MQKSVWKHVRLRKDYVNKEPISHHAGYKLKIPMGLLKEKQRTQLRFYNMKKMNTSARNQSSSTPAQGTSSNGGSGATPYRNALMIRRSVESLLNTLRTAPIPVTIFKAKPFHCPVEDVLVEAVKKMEKQFPGITSNKQFFLDYVQDCYDRHALSTLQLNPSLTQRFLETSTDSVDYVK